MFYRSSDKQALFPAVRLTLTHHEVWRPDMNYLRTDSIQKRSSSTLNSN